MPADRTVFERRTRAMRFLHVLAGLLLFAPLWVNDRPWFVRGVPRAAVRSHLDLLEEALDRTPAEAERASGALLAALDPSSDAHASLARCVERPAPERAVALRTWLRERRPGRALRSALDDLAARSDVLRAAAHELLRIPPTSEEWRALDDRLAALVAILAASGGDGTSLGAVARRASDVVREARADLAPERIAALLERRGSDLGALVVELDRWVTAPPGPRRAWLETLGAVDRPLPGRTVASWPVFAALRPLEGGAMLAFLVDLLWRGRRRGRRGSRRAAILVLAALVGVVSAVAWAGDSEAIRHRTEVLAGRFEVETALYPPIPWSPDLSHGERPERPPSWWEPDREERSRADLARDPMGSREQRTRHWLGTDERGRDVLARLVYGGRASLGIAVLAAVLTTALGILLAVGAALWRPVDALVRIAIEVVLCLPTILVVLASVMVARAQLGPSPAPLAVVAAIAAVLASFRWTQLARLLRFEFARIVHLPFVDAARALGAPPARLVLRNVLPHATTPILVFLAFEVIVATILESSLAFLGFGLPEPLASWGHLLRSASANPSNWWLVLFPTLVIVATLVALNAVSDGLQARLDPRRRGGARGGVDLRGGRNA